MTSGVGGEGGHAECAPVRPGQIETPGGSGVPRLRSGGSAGGEHRSDGPDAAADERVAKDAAVRSDDLPSGWQQEGGGENFESPCAPIQEASKLAGARYTSPRFSTGDGPLTLNVVYVFPDDAAARRGFELISSEETEDCAAELTVAGLASDDDVEIGATEKRTLPIDPLGDQCKATRVTVPISGHALEMDLTTDVVVTRVGRGVTVNSFIHGSGSSTPTCATRSAQPPSNASPPAWREKPRGRGFCEWAIQDSNLGPLPYQRSALTD